MSSPSTEVPPPDPAEHHHDSKTVVPADSASSATASTRTVHPIASRVVQRPIPKLQLEDPRKFQIAQVTRRFSPEEATGSDRNTLLTFSLKPSDPDFPYELDVLECSLEVPANYPKSKPTLRIKNQEMGRGYQINVERGFDSIVQGMPSGTLLQYFNTLDRRLESYLSAPPADTIKLVANVGSKSRKPNLLDQRAEEGLQTEVTHTSKPLSQPSAAQGLEGNAPKPDYSVAEREQARVKREADVRQLEARLGRTPLFAKLPDGNSYTVPGEPRKRNELPLALQSIKSVRLIVPPTYNLEPCRIELPDSSGNDADALAAAFEQRAKQNSQLSLVAHMNSLSQNMHIMVAEWLAQRKAANTSTNSDPLHPEAQTRSTVDLDTKKEETSTSAPSGESPRSHIVAIPRPPEWATPAVANEEDGGESSSEASYDSSEENVTEDEDEEVDDDEESNRVAETTGPECGVLLSFPHLELHGIELLELISASFTIKCNRCKEVMDVNKIRNSIGDPSAIRMVSCKKCSSPFSIGMSPERVRRGHCFGCLTTPFILTEALSLLTL